MKFIFKCSNILFLFVIVLFSKPTSSFWTKSTSFPVIVQFDHASVCLSKSVLFDVKKQISLNKDAKNQYEFDEKLEAGIKLVGSEVKSCRRGHVQMSDGHCQIIDGECWLFNIFIREYDGCGSYDQHLPKRQRKLLLKKKEVSTCEYIHNISTKTIT